MSRRPCGPGTDHHFRTNHRPQGGITEETPQADRPTTYGHPGTESTLGTIFERCTGRSVFTALAEDLAAPLGFDDFDPARQRLLGRPEVSEHLAHHLFLSARDLGRLGTMMLQEGRWNDRQAVPASWVAQSTSIQVDRGADVQLDYGYLWWLPRLLGRGSFLAIGNFGQYLLCVPPCRGRIPMGVQYKQIRMGGQPSSSVAAVVVHEPSHLAMMPHRDGSLPSRWKPSQGALIAQIYG